MEFAGIEFHSSVGPDRFPSFPADKHVNLPFHLSPGSTHSTGRLQTSRRHVPAHGDRPSPPRPPGAFLWDPPAPV